MGTLSGSPVPQISPPLLSFLISVLLFLLLPSLLFVFSFLNIPLSSSLANVHWEVVVISGSGELLGGDQAAKWSVTLPCLVSP